MLKLYACLVVYLSKVKTRDIQLLQITSQNFYFFKFIYSIKFLTILPAPTSSRRPTCPPGFWSPWYNNDDANGYGENESLHVHRTRNPETLCEFPTAIEARVAGTLEPMQSVARNVFMSRITGLECLKMKGEPCVDHEVRFCCAPGKLKKIESIFVSNH